MFQANDEALVRFYNNHVRENNMTNMSQLVIHALANTGTKKSQGMLSRCILREDGEWAEELCLTACLRNADKWDHVGDEFLEAIKKKAENQKMRSEMAPLEPSKADEKLDVYVFHLLGLVCGKLDDAGSRKRTCMARVEMLLSKRSQLTGEEIEILENLRIFTMSR